MNWRVEEVEAEDKKRFRTAVVLAVIFHMILLLVNLPDLTDPAPAPEPEARKVYVVQQVRFKPPPPKQKQELPKPKKKLVPVPDPTPDEPEPIRPVEEVQPEIDMPDTDVIFDIPDGPPVVEAERNEPYLVGGEVTAPVRIFAPQPAYTEPARRARIEGIVIVQATIDREGSVTELEVLRELPLGLTEETVRTLKKWKFDPATLNGKPVPVYYTLTVHFRLQ